MNETDKLAEIDRKLDLILSSQIDAKLADILASLNEVLAWAVYVPLNTSEPLEQIDRKLGDIVSALNEFMAVAPRPSSEGQPVRICRFEADKMILLPIQPPAPGQNPWRVVVQAIRRRSVKFN
jgi:hypothetical protein